MKAMVVRSPKNPLVLEEREALRPGPGQVRIKVHACGVCHSDQLVTDGLWPGLTFPRIPGHEVAGIVDAVGEGAIRFKPGDRVGVGWYGGHDGTCDPCRRGRFLHCQNGRITGISFDGGYQEQIVVPEPAVAPIPDGMDLAEAAPLLCAGVTTFNALRNSPARPGDLVAVQGLGGLGHLGVQYARAMGFETAAISRGRDKEDFARQLGATHYFDSDRADFAEAMGKLGGARVILATAPHAKAISALVPALGLDGCLLVVAAPFEPIQVSALDLIGRDARIQGWASGTAADSADAMAFAQAHEIRPMIEKFPLPEAGKAVEAMMKGTVRFRAVLEVARR
ncbi:MAG TPA: alcohol dehydrogenase [Candidatus Polarisedimenticolia bacterium]|nr:alcohol dehydrogenase [Candidatus Polarisedimenticolia bacterium]